MSQTIAQQLHDVEHLFGRLGDAEGFEVYVDPLDPGSEEDVATLEQKLGYAVHPEIAAMWRRGFVSTSGTMEHDSFVSIGRDFCSPDIVLRDISKLRDIAAQWDGQEAPEPGSTTAEFVRLAREGFPLSFENPILVSDRSGAIYLFNHKDREARKVGNTLSEHLTAWLAAGGFNAVDDLAGQVALLEAVGPLLPAWASPSTPNVWLDTYRDVYFS
jgi:hypothetical protein